MPKADRGQRPAGALRALRQVELVRSGAVAVTRGPRALSEKVVGSEVTGR